MSTDPRIAVVGLGSTGTQTARLLASSAIGGLWLHDVDHDRARSLRDSLPSGGVGAPTRLCGPLGDQAEIVVLATPAGTHARLARRILAEGRHVVSISDAPGDVHGLLDLDDVARAHGRSVVMGAGFAPGLSCLLARHGANLLDEIEEVSVAKTGTGGPACAREHHRALSQPGHEYHHGQWLIRAGGSGRELAWFPDPIGAKDCYRADLPTPLLLARVFPGADRITSRVSATRRDRLTARLPMLRPPHADGGPGAIRVEVRGRRNGRVETVVFGVTERPSIAAGTVAAVVALLLARRPDPDPIPAGAFGLGELADPKRLLRDLHRRGIRASTYEGSGL